MPATRPFRGRRAAKAHSRHAQHLDPQYWIGYGHSQTPMRTTTIYMLLAVAAHTAWLRPVLSQPAQRSAYATHTCRGKRCEASRMVDPEGFDAVRDTVGPGIYGGKVKRDEQGQVIIGRQYQNHNPTPGPVYAGGGYTAMADAIHQGPDAVKQLLAQKPDLVHDVSTGGAMPLHICGMSRRGQLSTQVLIEAGADVHAVDTYGYTPLHRMASNNLAVGAQALVEAGADPERVSTQPYAGETPMDIARKSGAWEVVQVLHAAGATR